MSIVIYNRIVDWNQCVISICGEDAYLTII
jgi:hypothetical protein